MQENWLQLNKAFVQDKSFVLAIIIETKGSTYQKIGTMMLIAENGTCTGLLSGGCLEADISLHAQEVLKNNQSKVLTYDLQADENLLWGLGLGCDGALKILLHPLTPENNHLNFAQLLDAITNQQSGYYCLEPNPLNKADGQFVVHSIVNNKDIVFPKEISGNLSFVVPIMPPTSLLIIGAGPDAEPVVNFAAQLGWNVEIWDHRAGYLEQQVFAQVSKKRQRAEKVQSTQFETFDAAVVMTHNLDNDGQYLEQLISSSISYIGLLGPIGRRDKLLASCDIAFENVKNRVFGPVGLDLGGRGPQAIALSIAAQIQRHISHQNSGKHYQVFQR